MEVSGGWWDFQWLMIKVKVEVAQLGPTLCDPMDGSLPELHTMLRQGKSWVLKPGYGYKHCWVIFSLSNGFWDDTSILFFFFTDFINVLRRKAFTNNLQKPFSLMKFSYWKTDICNINNNYFHNIKMIKNVKITMSRYYFFNCEIIFRDKSQFKK